MLEPDRLMVAIIMLGRPLAGNELALKKEATEPVRMRFQCRNPERIKGSIQLCIKGDPYTIGVFTELGRNRAWGAGGPP
jgi:hypothetical protein